VLNGHEYLVQELWDNYTASCRQIPSSTFLPGTWPICGEENTTCAVTQKEAVTFGSNGHHEYFELNPESLGCNAHALGDPNTGHGHVEHLRHRGPDVFLQPAGHTRTRVRRERALRLRERDPDAEQRPAVQYGRVR